MPAYTKHLKRIYFDIRSPAGFSNSEILFNQARIKFPEIKRSDVKEFLSSTDTYTLNRTKRKRFPRDKIYSPTIDALWEIDLTFLIQYAAENRKFKYIMFCIDVFSKYLYAQPMKTKQGKEFIEVFKKVLASTTSRPQQIRCDSGGEFISKKAKAFLKQQNIHLYVSRNETKASIVERLQRSIKGYMYRYFQANSTHKWIDVLQDIVRSYNKRIHRSTGYAPEDVNFLNAPAIYKKMYPNAEKRFQVSKFRFNIGNLVRISLLKDIFAKSFTNNWSSEIYIIQKQIRAPIPRYRVRSLINNDILEGSFLSPELQPISILKKDLLYTTVIDLNETTGKLLLATKAGKQAWFTKKELS